MCFNGASAGHPFKCEENQRVSSPTCNQTPGTPGKAGGVRKTYKKLILVQISFKLTVLFLNLFL